MSASACHHVVYWTIPQINGSGVVVSERHYALNLAEVPAEDASRIESMLRSHAVGEAEAGETRSLRTDPKITQYRHLFRPFIEVKKRASDYCRFSMVWLPFYYAEFAEYADQGEPRHHAHPSTVPLAGVG